MQKGIDCSAIGRDQVGHELLYVDRISLMCDVVGGVFLCGATD